MFVSLGLGSVIASTVEVAPWLMVISRHKDVVFPVVGAMLAFNYWIAIARPKRLNCAPGELCHVDSPAMRVNRAMFWVSVAMYVAALVLTYGSLWWLSLQQ